MLHRIGDAPPRHSARCDRCLASSPVVEGEPDEAERILSGEHFWEIRRDRQTWCLDCSRDARTPKGRPTARGVVRRRRR
jgi:hypothetical protein